MKPVVENDIRQFLTDNFPLSAQGFTLAPEASLIEAGVIDSTGVLELIEFIESSLYTVINSITRDEPSGLKQAELILGLMLGFAQKNPGMTRVLIGDALVNEDERLQARVNQLLDRLEASLRQSARLAVTAGTLPADWDVNAYANAVIAFVMGRWHQFAKSGFKRAPMDGWPQQWRVFAA